VELLERRQLELVLFDRGRHTLADCVPQVY